MRSETKSFWRAPSRTPSSYDTGGPPFDQLRDPGQDLNVLARRQLWGSILTITLLQLGLEGLLTPW